MSNQELSFDEENIGLDTLKAVREGIGERMRMPVIIVGVGAREEFY